MDKRAALKKFTFVGAGLWVNEELGLSVAFDEVHRRTFSAYRNRRPYFVDVARGINGREIRFRSAEAAAAYILKHPEADGRISPAEARFLAWRAAANASEQE